MKFHAYITGPLTLAIAVGIAGGTSLSLSVAQISGAVPVDSSYGGDANQDMSALKDTGGFDSNTASFDPNTTLYDPNSGTPPPIPSYTDGGTQAGDFYNLNSGTPLPKIYSAPDGGSQEGTSPVPYSQIHGLPETGGATRVGNIDVVNAGAGGEQWGGNGQKNMGGGKLSLPVIGMPGAASNTIQTTNTAAAGVKTSTNPTQGAAAQQQGFSAVQKSVPQAVGGGQSIPGTTNAGTGLSDVSGAQNRDSANFGVGPSQGKAWRDAGQSASVGVGGLPTIDIRNMWGGQPGEVAAGVEVAPVVAIPGSESAPNSEGVWDPSASGVYGAASETMVTIPAAEIEVITTQANQAQAELSETRGVLEQKVQELNDAQSTVQNLQQELEVTRTHAAASEERAKKLENKSALTKVGEGLWQIVKWPFEAIGLF